MIAKNLRVCVLATLSALVAVSPAWAEKPAEGGKAEEFTGKTFDLKEKGEATITLIFPAGKKATVTLRGEKKTDVHLFIYDGDKKLIAKDDSPGPDCDAVFTPKEGGKFTLVIRNLGPGDNKVPMKVVLAK